MHKDLSLIKDQDHKPNQPSYPRPNKDLGLKDPELKDPGHKSIKARGPRLIKGPGLKSFKPPALNGPKPIKDPDLRSTRDPDRRLFEDPNHRLFEGLMLRLGGQDHKLIKALEWLIEVHDHTYDPIKLQEQYPSIKLFRETKSLPLIHQALFPNNLK